MAKPPREKFHSLPDPDGLGWKVERDGETISRHRKQETSEAAAIKAGRKAEDDGGLGQAILHKKDGTIREERTYGDDPKKTKG